MEERKRAKIAERYGEHVFSNRGITDAPQSAFVPAVKSILPSKEDEAKRREARRKSLGMGNLRGLYEVVDADCCIANRRVSFAPEATLHTWDVIEYMRDQTTSSASSESTRRASNVTRSSNSSSPLKQSFTPSSDPAEPPSTPPEQADEAAILPSSPAPQRDLHQKKHRRSSVIPPMNFNNPDDAYSSSGMSGSSDVSGSEDDQESESDEDATGTAMSLDDGIDEEDTAQSGETDSSTGSSARLEAALRQAATAAGTRGIDFDEHGDMSMELAGDEVTNALKPWVQKTTAEPFEMKLAPPLPDQENINPFSPAFKAQLVSGAACRRPETIQEEQEEDMSMDMTRAVGGILRSQPAKAVASSPVADNTMELTQAIGGIRSPAKQAGQKRRRSTIEDGSPAASINADKGKRRRSSVARSSMGDDTMDLTIAMGGIQSQGSPLKPDRRKSVAKRRSSGLSAEQDDRTREFTQAVGGIRSNIANLHEGDESFDTNEELTMELTTVLGGIDAAGKANANAGPSTPVISQSPLPNTNTTPKDQDRFKDVPDSGPKKLLTPIFEKQGLVSASQPSSRRSQSPLSARRPKAIHFNESEHMEQAKMEQVDFHLTRIEESPTADSARTSPYKEQLAYPSISELIVQGSPKRSTPRQSPDRVHSTCTPTNPIDTNVAQVDEQSIQASPSVQKQMRSSPLRPTLTPVGESVTEQAQSLHDSIKLLGSTPNKKVVATPLKRLQNLTPKKQTPARLSTLRKVATPKAHATPRTQIDANGSPVRQLSDDIAQVQASGKQVEKIRLNDFLEAAGIRFMDLETTKRRLTVAPTPSKAKQGDGALVNVEEVDVSLESAVVVGTSTVPSLDLFMHSCRELKKYISEGKTVIKSIETDSYRNTPPLIQAYLTASSERKAAIDAQLREIKTHARLRSKETWYAWRSQLLDGFMNALKDIGEGLIADDDALKRAEELLQTVLPELVEQQEVLHAEAERLQDAAVSTTDEEKEELDAARERVTAVESEMEEKRLWVEELQREIADQDTFVETREESKAECSAAIQEADRVREACRGWSISEVNALKGKLRYRPQLKAC